MRNHCQRRRRRRSGRRCRSTIQLIPKQNNTVLKITPRTGWTPWTLQTTSVTLYSPSQSRRKKHQHHLFCCQKFHWKLRRNERKRQLAKWCHLRQFYDVEKIQTLTVISPVTPSPTQKKSESFLLTKPRVHFEIIQD